MEQKKFKLGDNIVCVDDEYGYFPLITFGKMYKVVDIPTKLYNTLSIINDKGNYCQPNWNRFVTLKEWRRIKIEELKKL